MTCDEWILAAANLFFSGTLSYLFPLVSGQHMKGLKHLREEVGKVQEFRTPWLMP